MPLGNHGLVSSLETKLLHRWNPLPQSRLPFVFGKGAHTSGEASSLFLGSNVDGTRGAGDMEPTVTQGVNELN